jgi:hypothetical protein
MRTSPPNSGDATWYMQAKPHHGWSYSLSWINAQDQSIFAPGGRRSDRCRAR